MSVHLLIQCTFSCISYFISRTVRYFCSTQMELSLVHHKIKILYHQIINCEHHIFCTRCCWLLINTANKYTHTRVKSPILNSILQNAENQFITLFHTFLYHKRLQSCPSKLMFTLNCTYTRQQLWKCWSSYNCIITFVLDVFHFSYQKWWVSAMFAWK
jgi:hypothetical protein